jgi:hypothetical protein
MVENVLVRNQVQSLQGRFQNLSRNVLAALAGIILLPPSSQLIQKEEDRRGYSVYAEQARKRSWLLAFELQPTNVTACKRRSLQTSGRALDT